MLKATITALFLLFATTFAAQAQAPEPDFVNQPMLWDRNSPTLTSIHKTVWKIHFGTHKFTYTVKNAAAVTRIRTNRPYAFIIKPLDGIDPTRFVAIYKFNVNKDKDERKAVGLRIEGNNNSNDPTQATEDMIGYSIKKAGPGIYEIVPDTPLAPGEYAFVAMGSMYEFGIE